jgi:hypothetical protein
MFGESNISSVDKIVTECMVTSENLENFGILSRRPIGRENGKLIGPFINWRIAPIGDPFFQKSNLRERKGSE